MAIDTLVLNVKNFLASKPPQKLSEYLKTEFVPNLTSEDVAILTKEAEPFLKGAGVEYRSVLLSSFTNTVAQNVIVTLALLVTLKDSPFRQQAEDQLSKVTHLNIVRSSNAYIELLGEVLPHLLYLENLRLIELSTLKSLEVLNTIAVKPFKTLFVGTCKQITDVTPLGRLTSLENLHLFDLPKVTDISVLRDLPKLSSLTLQDLGKGLDISVLAGKKFEYLTLKVGADTELSVLEQTAAINYLNLKECKGLKSLDFVAKVSGLQTLWLNLIDEIKDFSFLAQLPELKKLVVGYPSSRPKPVDLKNWPVSIFPQLESLTFYSTALKTLDFLPQCTHLKEFSAELTKDLGIDWTVLTETHQLEKGTITLANFKKLTGDIRQKVQASQPNLWLG